MELEDKDFPRLSELFLMILVAVLLQSERNDISPWVCLRGDIVCFEGFPGPSSKESACKAGDAGLNPGWGRSPGGGHGNPLQYSYLENTMDRGAWWATAHAVTELDTTDLAHMHTLCLEKSPPHYLSNWFITLDVLTHRQWLKQDTDMSTVTTRRNIKVS